MPLDASILLQGKPVALPDPLTTYGNALAIASGQQKQQMNALQLQQEQAQFGEQNALRARVSAPDFSALPQQQQIAEIQRVAPIAGQPVVNKMVANQKTITDTASTSQEMAQKGRAAAIQAVAAAKTPDEMITAGMDGVRNGAWTLQNILPQLQHLTDGTVTADNLPAYRTGLLKQILTPQQQLEAGTPKPTAVETGGGTAFVNTNPNAGSVAPMTGVIAGNPKPVTGPNGDMLTQSADGSTVNRPTFVAAPPATTPQVSSTAPGIAGGVVNNKVPPAAQAARDGDGLKMLYDELKLPERQDPANQAAIKAEIVRKGGTVPPDAGASAGKYPIAVPAQFITPSSRNPTVKDFNAPEAAKRASDYEADLTHTVSEGQNLMQLNAAFQDALTRYQAGPGAPQRLAVAKALAALGVSPDKVDAVNRGTIADAQEINKLGVIGTIASLKQANAGGGAKATTNRTEYANFAAANPSIETDPGATAKIQAFQAEQYQRNYAELQALNAYKAAGADPSNFPADYARTLDAAKLLQPAVRTDARGTADAATAGSPVHVTSDQQYASLPSGTRYVGPDGHTRVKR